MEDLLIQILETFGYPVMLQGSMLPDEKYPDHFFTFWNNSSDDEAFFDNKAYMTVYDYSVNFYSTDPALVYTKLREAKKALEENGFIVNGDGHSVASDEKSHDGRGINALFCRR